MQIGPAVPSVKTDEAGVALLRDVPPGKYVVVIEHGRHAERRIEDVEVAADETVDTGTTELALGGIIHGVVKAADGGAVRFATVEVQPLPDGETRSESAMGGAFTLRGLVPGRYRVRARLVGPGEPKLGPPEEIEVEPGRSTRVEVRLPEG